MERKAAGKINLSKECNLFPHSFLMDPSGMLFEDLLPYICSKTSALQILPLSRYVAAALVPPSPKETKASVNCDVFLSAGGPDQRAELKSPLLTLQPLYSISVSEA